MFTGETLIPYLAIFTDGDTGRWVPIILELMFCCPRGNDAREVNPITVYIYVAEEIMLPKERFELSKTFLIIQSVPLKSLAV